MGVGGCGAPAARAGARGRPGGHRGASLQPRGPGGRRNPAAPPRAPPAAAAPGRSLLRAELSRGEPEPWLPARFDRTLPSFPLVSPGSGLSFQGWRVAGKEAAVLCFLVLGRVFVPAAARPLRTGGRHGRRRPRSHGAEGERRRLGPARERSPALPGGALCPQLRRPEPAICRQAQKFRGPRAAETRLFMADPPSGGALGRHGPGKWGGGAERGGEEGPRRGRGRPTSPPDPAAAPESQAHLRLQGLSRERPARSGPRGSGGECPGRATGTGSGERVAGPGHPGGGWGGRWRTKEGGRGAGTFSAAPGQLQGGAARVPRGGG